MLLDSCVFCVGIGVGVALGVLSTLDAKLVTLDDKLLGLLDLDDAELLLFLPAGSRFTALPRESRDRDLVCVEIRPGALTGRTPEEVAVPTRTGAVINAIGGDSVVVVVDDGGVSRG